MADAVIEANQGEAVYSEEVQVEAEPSMEEIVEE